MKKRILSYLLAFSIVCISIVALPTTNAYAETLSGTCGENLTWSLDENGVLTISGNGDMTNFKNKFEQPWYDKIVTTLTIEKGVTSIGSYAFYEMTRINEVNIPEGVTKIGDSAFQYCLFHNANIPNSVVNIGPYAFYFCDYLESITIPKNVLTIGEYSFSMCRRLSEIMIPDSVISIGASAFCRGDSLTTITVDPLNKYYKSIEGVLFNKSGTKLIQCPGQKSGVYAIPEIVNTIEKDAFNWCTKLTNVIIPEGVTSIGDSSFYWCSNLNSISIPCSMTNISNNAFNKCDSLISVNYNGSAEQWENLDIGYSNEQLLNATVVYGESSSTTAYVIMFDANGGDGAPETQTKNKGENITLSLTVPTREGYSFKGWATTSNATEIDYAPGTLFSIDADTTLYAVWEENSTIVSSGTCGENLTWSLSEDGVLTISGNGDMNDYSSSSTPWCSNNALITTVIIENGVTSIGNRAFYYCYNITSLTMPEGITRIGNSAFYSCSRLTNLIMPNSVEDIGTAAFYCCFALENITISNNVTSIKNNTFGDCDSLTSITIPDSVTEIENYAFNVCYALDDVYYIGTKLQWSKIAIGSGNSCLTGANIHYSEDDSNINGVCGDDVAWKLENNILTIYGSGNMYDIDITEDESPWELYKENINKVIIEEGVTSIGNGVFFDCYNLTEVNISDSVNYIGDNAFYDCVSLSMISISEGVSSIGQYAFRYCENIESIFIPSTVISIGYGAFENCTSLQTVNIPKGVSELYSTFYACYNLKIIEMSSGLNIIGDYTFAECQNLTSIVIPNGVREIGTSAFDYCTHLTTITLPLDISVIGEYAFYGCSSLSEVYYNGTKSDWDCIYIYNDNENLNNATIHFKEEQLITIASGNCGENLTWILDNKGTLTISGYGKMDDYQGNTVLPWYDNKNEIQSVIIENGVTSIGNYAFSNCENLESIILSNSVISIGEAAFSWCYSLYSITLPNSITNIDNYAFYYCTGLDWIEIPNGVTSIGEGVFYECRNLTTVTIPNSVTNIGYGSFQYCSALTTITIPDSVTNIGDQAFAWTDLETITIPDSVTSIGEGAFYACNELTSITLSENIATISKMMFGYCDSLVAITLPEKITIIDDIAFWHCENLVSVVVPNNVTSIGREAFSNCKNLEVVTISDGVASIGSLAFDGCNNLNEVYASSLELWCNIDFSCEESNPLHNGGKLFIDNKLANEILVPNNITEIKNYAFYGCSNITSITLPDNVTRIGLEAFANCNALNLITLNDNLINIGNAAFYNTGYYNNSSNWINDVLYINNWLIASIDSLSGKYYMKDGCVGIADSAFRNRLGLTSINIPNSVMNIGNSVFSGCNNLTDIAIPNSVTNISRYSFEDCSGLTSVTIPKSISKIYMYAFSNCSNLIDVYYYGTEEEWNNISIEEGNSCLLNATIHYKSDSDNDDVDTPTIVMRTISGNFSGGEDIIYNADEGTYNMESFMLIGFIENLFMSEDFNNDDIDAKNVKVEISLPDGYSFSKDYKNKTVSYTFNAIPYCTSTTDIIYLDNPPVGKSTLTAKITGDNINDTIIEYDFCVEKYVFQVDVYRANHLINSKTGNIMEDTYLNIEKTPCKILYDSGQENGLDTAVNAWSAVMNTLEAADKPSSIVDYAFEEKDIYEALIMSLFESSVDYKIMDCINNEITKQTKNLVSTVTAEMKTLYNLNLANSADFKNMPDETREDLIKHVSGAFKMDHENAAAISDLTKYIGYALKYASDFQSACEMISAYGNIRQLSDSMKQVMRDMYAKCPNDNLALKVALYNCIDIMESGDAEFFANMTAYGVLVAGKDVAQFGMDKFWSGVKTSFSFVHPAAFAFQAAYIGGKYITQVFFNADAIAEKYYNIVAMITIENVLNEVYSDRKNTFINNNSQSNAMIYNSVVDVMFNMKNTDCNSAISYLNAVDNSLASKLSNAFGDTTIDDANKSIKSIQNSSSLFYISVLTDWITKLYEDNINKYYEYEHLVDEAYENYRKKYNINCPVDVYVFDKNGVIVASVVDNAPFCRQEADITIAVEGNRKTIYMNGETEYDIVYKGNDVGTMDIAVTEYDETGNTVRNVYLNDIALTPNLIYTSTENGTSMTEDAYILLDETNVSIVPDYDSLTSYNKESYNVQITQGYFTDTMTSSQELHCGEKASITAYTPKGYEFAGWSSDYSTNIFDNSNDINTNVTIPNTDVKIAANFVEKLEEGVVYDKNTQTVTITSNVAYQNIDVIIASYDISGKLISLKNKKSNITKGRTNIVFNDFECVGASTIKVMVWESMDSLKPLFKTYTTTLNEKEVCYDKTTNTIEIDSLEQIPIAELIVASYQDGRLIKLQSKTVDINVGQNTYDSPLEDYSGADTIKVMVWNSLNNIKPLFDSCTIKLK